MIRLTLLLLIAAIALPLRGAESPRSFQLKSLYHVGYWVRDIAKSRQFYHDFLGYDEPYVLNRPDGSLQMVIMKVNERQVILLFNDPKMILPSGDNLDHLGFETDNNAAAREHLLAHGIKVGTVNRGRIGDLLLGVRDPDNNYYEVTQLEPVGQLLKHQGKGLSATRISDRLRSATIPVADLPAAMHFYRDILGFKRIDADHHGLAMAGIVRVQVTDSTDYLELVPYQRAPGAEPARRAPEYCLEVPDAAKALEILTSRAKALGLAAPAPLSLSPDGRRQTSAIDPDGIRVIFREPSAAK